MKLWYAVLLDNEDLDWELWGEVRNAFNKNHCRYGTN